ncbi:MAG: DUF2937 family protein [Pseudomonadota bacterium]
MGHLINLSGGVVCLCAASQFPEYSQQYVQRLGGAVDELRLVASDFDKSAKTVGMTREEALASMTGNAFQDLRRADMTRTFDRLDRLSTHYEMLKGSTAMQRLTAISRFDDRRIAARAWDDFKPGIPLTFDGLTFAAVGFLTGFAGLFGLGWAAFALRRRIWPEPDIFAEGVDP